MRKTRFVLTCFSALYIAASAEAQMPNKSVAVIYGLKAKPGSDLEAALKKHMEWHAQQHDTWGYGVWQTVSGERTGEYLVGTFGHDWKDFDARTKFEEADRANARETVEPMLEARRISYWLHRADLSTPAETSAGQTGPDPFAEVFTFYIKPDAWDPAIEEAIKKVKDAAKKASYPLPGDWFMLLNGAGEREMVLAIGHKDWADFQPPAKNMAAMLTEAYGAEGTRNLFNTFYGSMLRVDSAIIRYRPDLSYVPAAAK